MLAVYDNKLISNNYSYKFYFLKRPILIVKRQTTLNLYFIDFNMILNN